MSVQELKSVISQLPPDDLADLAHWIEEFQSEAWDRQIAQDVKSGRLDNLLQRAKDQVRTGQVKPL